MARQARVISIDALLGMQAALSRFERDLRAALDDLEMEVRRALEWLHQEMPQYWQQEVRQGWQRVSEARVQLQQAMTMRRVAEHEPSCLEEKKALEKARRRVQLAEEKLQAVRHWRHAVDKAADDYLAARGQLAGWLEAELPQARTALKHMLAALESYVAIEVPAEQGAPPAAATAGAAQHGEQTAARPEQAASGGTELSAAGCPSPAAASSDLFPAAQRYPAMASPSSDTADSALQQRSAAEGCDSGGSSQ